MPTAYTLRVSQPEARRCEIEVACDAEGAQAIDFRVPVWTPGSYLVREHERHVDGFAARDEQGRPLAVAKADKHTWRVQCAGARRVAASYRLGAFELTVRTNHVDPTHAFVNPAAAFAYPVGREAQPCALSVQLPAGWQAWVALPRRDGGWIAQDFDELADSPIEAGPPSSHSAHAFTARGVPHDVVLWGRGDFDARKVVPDMAKIADALAEIFGGLPFSDPYLFIVHLNDRGRGGLEHRRSCALLAPRFTFAHKPAYEDFLLLVAHEYFHLWNVKRLRPAAFTPYDWTRENHTRLLWAMEGLTSTYEVLALRRAGLIPPRRVLEILAERATSLLRTPGRLRTSLAQASYDAWIKHYRPDESTPNTTVSYYLKGSVVGMLLDLELRRRTEGKRSLDDLMRLLYERHGRAPGLPEDGVEKAAIELAGGPASGPGSLQAWFDRCLRSTEELPLDEALAGLGLKALLHSSRGPDDKGGAEADPDDAADPGEPPRGWLGATLRDRNGALEVTGVAEGSPAQQAGLCVGDDLVALDGFRSEMKQRLSRSAPGSALRATVFRLDELIELPLRLAPAPRDTVTIVPDEKATPAQLALREAWLGGRWPEPEEEDGPAA